MGGTVCICRDPPILYRKFLSFYEEFNIIIYALSIKIRGGKKDYIEAADMQIYPQ